jgi:hypothetical protein
MIGLLPRQRLKRRAAEVWRIRSLIRNRLAAGRDRVGELKFRTDPLDRIARQTGDHRGKPKRSSADIKRRPRHGATIWRASRESVALASPRKGRQPCFCLPWYLPVRDDLKPKTSCLGQGCGTTPCMGVEQMFWGTASAGPLAWGAMASRVVRMLTGVLAACAAGWPWRGWGTLASCAEFECARTVVMRSRSIACNQGPQSRPGFACAFA